MDPHDRNETITIEKTHNRKEANNMVNTQAYSWHDAQSSMMDVRFKYTSHGKVKQTTLQFKWSSIYNELYIDETPHQLFSSLSVLYPTILNVIKHGKW